MKQIQITTDVFARIWSLRRDGEETENEILARVLSDPVIGQGWADVGFAEHRYGVVLPNGFRIFRVSKGRRYDAAASGGVWHLDGEVRSFRSLNELSRAIGAGAENAWLNWFYLDEDGHRHPLGNLRKNEMVRSRQGPNANWVDDVVEALEQLGGRAPLSRIYEQAKRIRRAAGKTVPRTLDAIVRRTLEECCSETESYKERANLFAMPEGKGAGIWALR
jgi:hypothetical protein